MLTCTENDCCRYEDNYNTCQTWRHYKLCYDSRTLSWFYKETRNPVSWLPVNGDVCKHLRPASSRHLLLTYVTEKVNYISCGEYSRLLRRIFAEEVWRYAIKIKNCYKLLRAEVKFLFYNPVVLRILAWYGLSGW